MSKFLYRCIYRKGFDVLVDAVENLVRRGFRFEVVVLGDGPERERIEGASGLEKCRVLLVNPGFAVSTQWVYDNLALTSRENPNILASGKDCPTHLNSVSGGVFSHLPEPCFFNHLVKEENDNG